MLLVTIYVIVIVNNVAFALTDSEVRIEGLETLDYLDNLSQKERFTEQGDAITFESEVKSLNLLLYSYSGDAIMFNHINLSCCYPLRIPVKVVHH